MKEEKKKVMLCGRLIRPVVVGKTAIYITGGRIYHTSRVVAVHEQTKSLIHFETRIAHYYLSMEPYPASAVILFPPRMNACA